MSYTQYTVTAPERWDNIAFKAYGDATKISVIIEANPTVRAQDVLPSGTVLNIPILETPTITASKLPPWKR